MMECESNTPGIAMRIMRAAEKRFPDQVLDAVFEHGHWWLVCIDRMFSVCDAEADTVAREQELGIVDGFIFEEV